MSRHSFPWKDYLTLAQKLMEDGGEPSYRSSVSRAYYCVFNLAKRKAGVVERDEAHKKVIEKLKKSPLKSLRTAGGILDGLRKTRNDADYEASVLFTRRHAEDALSAASNLISSLNSADSDYV